MIEAPSQPNKELLTFVEIRAKLNELIQNRAKTAEEGTNRKHLKEGTGFIREKFIPYLESTENSFEIIDALRQLFQLTMKRTVDATHQVFANVFVNISSKLAPIVFPSKLIPERIDLNTEETYLLDPETNKLLMHSIRTTVIEHLNLTHHKPDIQSVITTPVCISRQLSDLIVDVLGVAYNDDQKFLQSLNIRLDKDKPFDIQEIIALYKIHLLMNCKLKEDGFEAEFEYIPKKEEGILVGEIQNYELTLEQINISKGFPEWLLTIIDPRALRISVAKKLLNISTDEKSLEALYNSPISSIIFKKFILDVLE